MSVRRKPPVDHGFEQRPHRLVVPFDWHAGGESCTAAQYASRLAQCHREVRRELDAMTTNSCIEIGVRKGQPFDVHHLEPGVGYVGRSCDIDHPGREVDADDLATGRPLLCKTPAQRPWPASQVEHAHARQDVAQLEHTQAAARFAPLHHLLDALLVGQRVPPEQRREELLRFHGVKFFHSRSSQSAALSASTLVRPTTCIPTGSPPRGTGAGSATTGWPVVLNGRVKRASGSRTSSPAPTGGATIAVAGSSKASTPSIACCASACKWGRSRRASSESTARMPSPRRMWPSTSAPYFSGNSPAQRR